MNHSDMKKVRDAFEEYNERELSDGSVLFFDDVLDILDRELAKPEPEPEPEPEPFCYSTTQIDRLVFAIRAALQQPDDAKQRLLEIMRKNGLATGHGDTIDDALKELDWQLSELKGKSDGTL